MDFNVLLTFLYILPENVNKVSPIRPRMLVPEPHCVSNLVHHYAKLVAILANRNPLAPIPLASNIRAAAEEKKILLEGT